MRRLIDNLSRNVIVIQYAGLVAVTLATLIGFQAAFGNVLTAANLEVLAMNMVFEGIMALGMTFVIIMGGIDLSVASVYAFGEIFVAKLMVQAGLPIAPAILITLAACAGMEP
jgi:ribose/xylose/arabinose/galactoside ABC-type transport system permease subunit